MNKKTSPHLYETPDLYFAAYVKSKGFDLMGQIVKNGRLFFQFTDPDAIGALMVEYMNGGPVNVSIYNKALKDLRSLIFSVLEHETPR